LEKQGVIKNFDAQRTMRQENYETKIKSNRQPLCGGQDISIGVRDKVISVMERNRKRSMS